MMANSKVSLTLCASPLTRTLLLLNLITLCLVQIYNHSQIPELNHQDHNRAAIATSPSQQEDQEVFHKRKFHGKEKFDPSIWKNLEPSRVVPPHEQAVQVGRGDLGCVRQTNHTRRHALMRVIVFQKDGQMQLQNLISHYIQALRYDEIVIINHDGNDPFTLEIIDQYAQLGVHVWNCNGTMEEVMKADELAKGQMWSDVISMYKSDSEFLLPVDVDEHLMLRMGAKPGSPFHNGSYITWNRDDLSKALSQLSTSGKFYKTANATVIPYDCGMSKSQIRVNRTMVPICIAKIFFRGVDFNGTDAGNHYGIPRDEFAYKCQNDGVENVYEITNFIMVHHQVTCFNDWLLHSLRVANEKGLTDKAVNCSQQDSRRVVEICNLWHSFAADNFSVWKMKDIYQDRVCSMLRRDESGNSWDDLFVGYEL